MKRWIRQRRLELTFVGLIAVGAVALLYWPLHHQAVGCSFEEALPSGPENQQGQPQGEQPAAQQTQNPTVAQGQQNQPNKNAAQATIHKRGGLDLAVCNASPTDIALVFFTYCLVVVGWVTMRSNEKTMREIERGRLYGAPAHRSQ